MLDRKTTDRVIRSVEDGFEEQIAYTQSLVRFRSTRGAEHAVQDYVYRMWRDHGFKMDRFAMDRDAIAGHPGAGMWSDGHSDAPIVVGLYHPKTETGRSLTLQAHVDVVPPGPLDMWTRDPFDPHVEGDWLYGRGGADMKAGHAANLYAFEALRRIGLAPAATVNLMSVVEEESTGNGALMTHLRGYRADAVLIPEPEEEMLVRANTGVIWFQVHLSGTPVHVREMGSGANAIDAAYRVMSALRQMEADWNAARADHPHFSGEDHPINLNLGRIEGGDWASSVPSWCRLDCRVSIYPGTPAARAACEIKDRIAAFAHNDPFLSNNPPRVTFNGFHAEGYVQPEGSEAEAVLDQAHRSSTGEALQSFVTPGYLDARVHALYEHVPTLCYGPKSENIHGIDERVSLASLRRVTTAMALFIAEWCGTEAA